LDKATREYYNRRARLEMPGWIAGMFSITTLVTGILLNLKTLIAIGILLLAISLYTVIIGRTAHKTLFRR